MGHLNGFTINIDEEKVKAVYDEIMDLLYTRTIKGKETIHFSDIIELETIAKCVYKAAKGAADQMMNEYFKQAKKGHL